MGINGQKAANQASLGVASEYGFPENMPSGEKLFFGKYFYGKTCIFAPYIYGIEFYELF
jgi:hypothetical protein